MRRVFLLRPDSGLAQRWLAAIAIPSSRSRREQQAAARITKEIGQSPERRERQSSPAHQRWGLPSRTGLPRIFAGLHMALRFGALRAAEITLWSSANRCRMHWETIRNHFVADAGRIDAMTFVVFTEVSPVLILESPDITERRHAHREPAMRRDGRRTVGDAVRKCLGAGGAT